MFIFDTGTGPLMTEVPLMDDGGGGGSTGSAPSDSSSAGNSQGGVCQSVCAL